MKNDRYLCRDSQCVFSVCVSPTCSIKVVGMYMACDVMLCISLAGVFLNHKGDMSVTLILHACLHASQVDSSKLQSNQQSFRHKDATLKENISMFGRFLRRNKSDLLSFYHFSHLISVIQLFVHVNSLQSYKSPKYMPEGVTLFCRNHFSQLP